jgi:hypothetical protein
VFWNIIGKVSYPQILRIFDEKADEGKRMLRIIDLNEMAFIELVLSIDVSSYNGKMAFGIVKSCKTKVYKDGNARLSWEKLKKKYDPASDPSLVKTEILFRGCKLGRDEHSETWIASL